MKKPSGQVSNSLNVAAFKENKAEPKTAKYPEDDIDMLNVFFKNKILYGIDY